MSIFTLVSLVHPDMLRKGNKLKLIEYIQNNWKERRGNMESPREGIYVMTAKRKRSAWWHPLPFILENLNSWILD